MLLYVRLVWSGPDDFEKIDACVDMTGVNEVDLAQRYRIRRMEASGASGCLHMICKYQ
jgi:hypothetical protein